jgi:Trk K+ transport system NAD-binding subunit
VKRGLPVQFGDAEDPAFLESLPLAEAGWVITTLPQWDSNRALLHALAASGFKGKVAGAAREVAHVEGLAEAGVEPVLNPFLDAADYAAQRLGGAIRGEGSAAPAAQEGTAPS